MQKYYACATHAYSKRNIMFVFNALSNSHKMVEFSNPTTYLTGHTKDMPITDNLTKTAQTTLVQARGLGKLHWPAILSHLLRLPHLTLDNIHPHLGARQTRHPLLVKTTTSDIRQTPSTGDNLLGHWTISFSCKPAQSLGSLCTVQDPQNTCDILHGTLRHVSTIHANPAIRAQTLVP